MLRPRSPQTEPSQQSDRRSESFYLPDLCHAQSLLFLVVLAELLALVITALQHGLSPVDWQHFSLVSLYCLLVFLSSALALCPLRDWLAQRPTVSANTLIYSLVLAIVALYSLAAQWLLNFTQPGRSAFDPNQLFTHLFVGAVVAGIGLRYLYLSWQLRQREQSEMNARIQALQSRIKPHFLFNSLNTIAGLIHEDSGKAERAVEDLSALFRANLQDSGVLSRWAEEYELCQRYLRIEQIRLGERLTVDWQVQAVPPDMPILSLSLQPLLENAVTHGIQHLPEGGTIVITASVDEDICHIGIQNPIAADRDSRRGNQLACENLKHRLASVYGEQGKLTLEIEACQFQVDLQFPYSAQGAA